MKKTLITIFISLLLLNCTKKENTFDSFDYSFDGTFSEVYSIKFTQSDTVYLRYHWIGRNIDDTISPAIENVNYYGILNSEERIKLYDYIEKVNLFKYKSEYFENYADGSSYGINIQKDSKNKTVFVHSHKAPKEIDSISHWISRIKLKLKLKKSKKSVTFESKNGVLPPPPPPPPVIKN
jgi:hypothetical protein